MAILDALDAPSVGWADLFARVSQSFGREASQRLRVLSMICGADDPDNINLRHARTRTEMLLRQSAVYFEQGIDTVHDNCACPLASMTVSTSGRGKRTLRTTCKKNESICDREDEITAKRSAFEAAGDALIASSDSAHRKLGKAAKLAAGKPTDGKGAACYRTLGDVSIASDALAAGESILTTDASFEVIGPAIGVDVERIAHTTLRGS
jgi:hypothetical protein